MKKPLIFLFAILFSFTSQSHESEATATYLGNEGVMVNNGKSKIVFDPFFHNNYNIYQLVPDEILKALFEDIAPYDNIDAIFVSHAHGDHFAADLVFKYLKSHPKTKLIAPKQAIDKLAALENSQSLIPQTTAIELKYGDQPKIIEIDNLKIEAVSIPHSGWPTRRTEISNIVFRVTLDDSVTVMHMGDADPNDIHFKPFENYWMSTLTNTAFPPYWFFNSTYGPEILSERINTEKSIGIHVPIQVPANLKLSGETYFSKPSEQQPINHKHKKL